MANEICERGMLVSLSIQGLGAILSEVEDKRIGDELAVREGVNPEVLRVMKRLLDPKRVPEIKAVSTARNELYTYFRKHTLRWSEPGWGGLPATQYFDFTGAINERKDALEGTFNTVLARWPELEVQAKAALNGAWKDDDWPDAETLRRKFAVRVKVRPLADASQFRALIGVDEEIAAVRKQIEEDLGRDLTAGLIDLLRQLRTFLADEKTGFITRVGSYEVDPQGKVLKSFKDSAVVSLRELCARVRSLNMMGEPHLNQLIDEIESGVCNHSAEDLRDNHVLRTQTVEHAELVAKKLAAVEEIFGRRLEAA